MASMIPLESYTKTATSRREHRNRVYVKTPKGVLLTVTSIHCAEGPGDARPPENCGHVTDPPHPDP